MYIWKPVPPTPDFVALGVVATTTADEPPLDSVRTVNRGFVNVSRTKPARMWDSSGLGGKKGSFWTTTLSSSHRALGLMAVSDSMDPPTGEFYEPNVVQFIAGNFFKLSKEAPQLEETRDLSQNSFTFLGASQAETKAIEGWATEKTSARVDNKPEQRRSAANKPAQQQSLLD